MLLRLAESRNSILKPLPAALCILAFSEVRTEKACIVQSIRAAVVCPEAFDSHSVVGLGNELEFVPALKFVSI